MRSKSGYDITMPDIAALAQFLDAQLETDTCLSVENTLYRHSLRPVRRLGLALEADFDVPAWVEMCQIDAVFLHRPWKIDTQALPADIGILAAHAPFDDHLTLGVNPRLAAILGLRRWEPFGDKDGRPLGMVGQIAPLPLPTLETALTEIFGGLDFARTGDAETVTAVAVVNALTDTLVRDAHRYGAQAYVTGQMRGPAQDAMEQTGISVFAVGHQRCEQWGLGALAGMLRERWAELEVCLRV